MTATEHTPTAVRPFYWSVRRELWEHRSIYMAPLAVAGVVLVGVLLGAMSLAHSGHALAALRLQGSGGLAAPYEFVAFLITLTGLIVGVVYSLGALYGERRDRGILFWKSLPVSDLTTVLAKTAVPLVVLPGVMFAVIVVTQIVMLLIATLVMALHGLDTGALWASVAAPGRWLALLYAEAVLAIWYAPVVGWLLLVSGWARRTTFLWAFLPPVAVCILEKIAFDTGWFAHMLMHRLGGAMDAAFDNGDPTAIAPLRFVSSPDVWIGLAVAAAFIAAAVWRRRRADPF